MCLTVLEVSPLVRLGSKQSPERLPSTDAINSIAYSPYLSAVVTIDHENTIKSYSVSPSTLGRGHALMDPSGPVWVSPPFLDQEKRSSADVQRTTQDVSASDYHPQLAVGSADGTCYTTNGLRATRRGGYVVKSFTLPSPSAPARLTHIP